MCFLWGNHLGTNISHSNKTMTSKLLDHPNGFMRLLNPWELTWEQAGHTETSIVQPLRQENESMEKDTKHKYLGGHAGGSPPNRGGAPRILTT